MRLQCFR